MVGQTANTHSDARITGENRSELAPGRERLFQPLPRLLWAVALALAGLGCFTSNPLLTPFSVMVLPVLASLSWFRGQPPVLLFACAIQWLQASAAIFYLDFYGLPLSQESKFGGAELVQATGLSLIGILVLAVGMRLALLGSKSNVEAQAAAEGKSLQPNRIFILYIIAFVVFFVVGDVAFNIPALTQLLLATITLKWVLIFLLAYSVLIQRRHFALIGIVVGVEAVFGILGFFSGFKSIFFMLLVTLASSHYVFKGWRLARLCVVAALLLALGVLWTAIKTDYRKFLNQGTGQQEVLVPVEQRLAKLGDLVGSLDRGKFDDGLEDMILRVSYVRFFALAITNVPRHVPYQNGALWEGTIIHVLTPRFLFPEKPAISDSDRTTKYTGIRVAGAEQGTSISIGYMGESYIDFGPIGMFAPILLLGLFYGLIYRFFVHHHPVKVVGLAIATSILLFSAYNIETSNIKLVGGTLMSLLMMGLFVRLAGARFWRLITSRAVAQPRRQQPLSAALGSGRFNGSVK